MSTQTNITREIADWSTAQTFDKVPPEARRIAKRCILDALGLIVVGARQECTRIVMEHCLETGGSDQATVFGEKQARVPAASAAMVNATAGHSMDWDDTQLSSYPDRVFGLLTHPTIPAFTAALAVAEKLGGVTGEQFITAFVAGFEVECKIAEAISPHHYNSGFHSSGTIGVFGAAAAAGKLMDLSPHQFRHLLGMAASMGAGIRVNFGTMTKPLHVGRAAHSGVTAALLAARGFEADPDGLDGPWGFFKVAGGGFDLDKIQGKLGNPFSIVDPGVSIKPYPCGSLTHPSIDAMLALVTENDLKPEDIEKVVLYAGSNILNPIRYETATNELEAKFCMPFLMTAIILSRKAGVREFTDEFVNSPDVKAMMGRVKTQVDPEIEARGYDKMLSRVEVNLKNGKKLVRESDERYRGGPDFPLSDAELQVKFTDCADHLFSAEKRQEIFETVAGLEKPGNFDRVLGLMKGK
ncbi:MmgE/PrpD family protein [bacterium]|nr:MmgE/PrpD family protein [bacterium]